MALDLVGNKASIPNRQRKMERRIKRLWQSGCNAAVPAEAFDATQRNTNALNNPFEFEDWVGYPAKSWASCWHSLFTTNDIRSKLTWKGRFAASPLIDNGRIFS